MEELWQLYDEHGAPLQGKGGTKNTIFGQGLLHGAAHVWIWRDNNGDKEVLLQKRAATKRTWPNRYDISAAGHINLGETAVKAAIRETKEEIGIDVNTDDLMQFGVHRTRLTAEDGSIENEFQWLYLLKLSGDIVFAPEDSELESVEWLALDTLASECSGDMYVPHGQDYYDMVIRSISEA